MNLIYNGENALDITLNTIFLAGPTSRTNTSNSWRYEAIRLLDRLGFNGNVIVPEPKDKVVSMEGFDKLSKIQWERKYLSIANIILFWIPRDTEMPAHTTNIEFGEWFKSGKVVLGFPDSAIKMDYINYLYKRFYPNSEITNTLESTVLTVVTKLKRPAKDWFTSDTHFGSKRTLELSRRGFIDVTDMDETLVSNWNSCVYAEDTVWHLGDFGEESALLSLSGQRIVVLAGNYDTEEFLSKLCDVDSHKRLSVIRNGYTLNSDITLIHEPESGVNNDTFYLYGHIHQLQMVKFNGLNVGTDCHKFKPIDYEVISFYKKAVEQFYDKNVFMPKLGYTDEKTEICI